MQSSQIPGLPKAVLDVVRHEHDMSVGRGHPDLMRLRNIAASLFRVPAARVGLYIKDGAVQFVDVDKPARAARGPLCMIVATPSTPDPSRVYILHFPPVTGAMSLSANILQEMEFMF